MKHLLEKKKGQIYSPEVFASSLAFEDSLVLVAKLDTKVLSLTAMGSKGCFHLQF